MSITFDSNDPRIKRGASNEKGQHEVYLALSPEERAKGFVRPVRHSYVHVGMAPPKFPLRDITEEETQKYKDYGYAKYETYPESSAPLCGRFWTQKELDSVNKGCGSVTTMRGNDLAETYARDPGFYGATYCVGCGRHIRVAEFVWDGTEERVGS